ncbi:MAG TPA: GAF domain-containing sensor histidine kinase [Ardenticatenaceae bacterium]|nr:GAF domain-containing sensor histidine kinase [Ardenticatenaceae bacterium]
MVPAATADPRTLLRKQESLREVIESISGELELRPLLTRIVVHACQLLGADNGTIGLVDERHNLVRTEAAYQMPLDELGAEIPSGVGLFGRVLVTQQPLILNRYGDVERPTQLGLLEHAVIGVPIFWRDQIIGVFGLGSAPPRLFTEHDVEVLSLFARHAAIAIANARRYEWEQRRTERLQLIARIGRIITADLLLDELLQRAADAIHELLGYPNIAIPVIDPEEPDVLLLRTVGGHYRGVVRGEYRIPVGDGIMGAAARTREVQLVNEVEADPRYIPTPGAVGITAELAVPILLGNRVLGVLNVESGDRFTDEDAAGLQIVADQLGVAIDNARRYQEEKRRNERLDLIARVGHRIAARLDSEELFTATVEELHLRLGYDHVSLFLLDPSDPTSLVQHARASRWRRGEAAGYRQTIETGILGAAARERVPQVVNDVTSDRRYIAVPRANELQAELAVPILLGDRLLGVLDLGSRRRFGEEDVTGIQIVAGQLAVAVDNARLFATTQRTLTETTLLYETSQRISTAMDVDDVIAAYLEQVATRGRYACTVVLYEHDASGTRTARITRGCWTPEEGLLHAYERQPYRRDNLDPPLDAGETVTIADVRRDRRVPAGLRDVQIQVGRPALAMIPLMASGQRIGLVVLSYPDAHVWRTVDLQPYQVTAAQLAAAIQSRQQQLLLYERGQQVAVLNERQRLARELHDSVTQHIFSMTLIAQAIAPAWRRDRAEGERRVNRLLELGRSALAEMRSLLTELRPPDSVPAGLDQGALPSPGGVELRGSNPIQAPASTALDRVRRDGLVAALVAHTEDLARDGLQIDLDARAYHPQVIAWEEALYRIVQEALNNVVKHASASHVDITLLADDGTVRLTVRDDGAGFGTGRRPGADGSAAPSRGGYGLKIMRERAEALGGTVEVKSAPGQGTVVEATFPSSEREQVP